MATKKVKERSDFILKEGYPVVGALGGVAVMATLFNISPLATLLLWGATLGVACLYRNPPRNPEDEGENLLLAPTDGEVVKVEEVEKSPILEREAVKVSIKTGFCDVHIPRSPVDGELESQKRLHGVFLPLSSPKAQRLNSQIHYLFKTPNGDEVEMVQLGGKGVEKGKLFRQPGEIQKGRRLGFAPGSFQIDLYLPKSVKLKVVEFEKVVGGETIIGLF